MATPLHRGYQQHAKTAPTLYLGCAACCAPFTPLSAPRIAGDRIHSNQDSDTNIPPDPRAAGPPRSPPHVQWVEGCIAGCVCGGVVPPVGLVRMDLPCTPHVVEVLPRVALALWGQASKSNTEVMSERHGQEACTTAAVGLDAHRTIVVCSGATASYDMQRHAVLPLSPRLALTHSTSSVPPDPTLGAIQEAVYTAVPLLPSSWLTH